MVLADFVVAGDLSKHNIGDKFFSYLSYLGLRQYQAFPLQGFIYLLVQDRIDLGNEFVYFMEVVH